MENYIISSKFKKEIQAYIREVSDKKCILPMEVMNRINKDVTLGYDEKLKDIAVKLHDRFGKTPKSVHELFEDFKDEINNFICPNWYCSKEEISSNESLNKKLIDRGYGTISCDTMRFLIGEFRKHNEQDPNVDL